MGDVRQIEQKLASLEDRILSNLGYREYRVFVNTTELLPSPQVIERPLSSYSGSQLQGFADKLGGQGNPITTFKIALSRDINEAVIRTFAYWRLVRESYEATCLPVEFQVKDSRLIVTLAVIKTEGPPLPLNPESTWDDELIWPTEKVWGS